MKFDFAIGNPPYQENFTSDGNKTYAAPVYNIFIDAANEIADKVELVHPARFLFNAGSTPKSWNEKMLNDPHFKVIEYEEDCKKIFANTEIKGGIAITYHDKGKEFGPIKVFTKSTVLNNILRKVTESSGYKSMEPIVITRTAFRLTDKMHHDYPEAIMMQSKGHPYDMSTNIFDLLPFVFFDDKPSDERYVKVLGRKNNQRVFKYIKEEYINCPNNLYKYKLFIPSANGNGYFGEALSSPIISEPYEGATETFISVGCFDTEYEAQALMKYIKTKFARAMLSILKTTQHLTPSVWKYVPLQVFKKESDINWNDSILEIDKQLYNKYNLTEEEISFIEDNVKEME